MSISGSGTGPFAVSGTETVDAIFDYVFAEDPGNASKSGTSYTFNCEISIDGTGTPVVIQTPSPTAEDVADAVRTELAVELGRLDAAVSTRLATAGYTAPPSAATNAAAVRTELATELGHIDADVSSRLAEAVYQTPSKAALSPVRPIERK